MSIAKPRLRPIKVAPSQKREVRTQFGALCYRIRQDKVQVLLITSRGTGRWIVPKGWPIGGQSPTTAAMQEAWEEAGVEGRVTGNCIGIYSYVKREEGEQLPCVVAIFPVEVRRLADRYPEAKQRRRKWFSLKKAAALLGEPELAHILEGFVPPGHGR